MKRVLLTGATGFIGRHCLERLLTAGYGEVHALSRNQEDRIGAGVHWHEANLLEPEQMQLVMAEVAPTHLLHMAWYAEPGKYWTSPENVRWLQASLSLFQAFAQHGGERIVAAGTCAEYDWSGDGICSEVSTPLVPATLYGASKHALHVMLEAFARQQNLSAAWGRVFFLYGPHEHPSRLVSSVIRSLLRGETARCSHGRQLRDFLHVADVADAFVALLDTEVRGAVNIGSGVALQLKDVIEEIGRQLKRNDLIQLNALSASENEPPVLVANVSRLAEEVGFHPRYDLSRGLEQTIDWWRQEMELQGKCA